MKKVMLFCLLLANLLAEPNIEVQHLILAKVNGKALSVIDVMKKMDIVFYRQFPQYADSSVARCQFYQANWKDALNQLIEKELVLADAKEHKIEVPAGDVRQEMEMQFGPNVIENLDKMGLTYDEAYKHVSEELMLRRTVSFRVTPKAFRKVTPLAIRQAYEEWARNNVRNLQWKYRVLAIRDSDQDQGNRIAERLHNALTTHETTLDTIKEFIATQNIDADTQIALSEEYHHNDLEISDEYKQVVSQMTPLTFSEPIHQASRRGKSVHRIFYLHAIIPGGPVPFDEAEPYLKDRLFDQAMAEETTLYFEELRKHFDIHDNDPAVQVATDFEPFKLNV